MQKRAPNIRTNFRGREVVGTAGIVLTVGLTVSAVISLAVSDEKLASATVLIGSLAMCGLGYLDDVKGDRRAGGLLGHARELLKGHLTTGLVKAAGGAVIGLVCAWALGWDGVWIVIAGGVVALGANLANLFDLRPGRAIKVWVVVWVLVAAAATQAVRLTLLGLVVGAVIFVAPELRERVMLGDTGAGLLGASLGIAAIASVGRTAVLIVFVFLVALTLASERVSFSRVIDGVPPLRWADRFGRLPD